MINHRGLWLPDGEKHLPEWMDATNRIVMGKPTYQYTKLEAALTYVRQFRTAVDVGAHAGLWSMHLARLFTRLHAFEPMEAHRECFARNVEGARVTLHPFALGNAEGPVRIATRTPGSSGDTGVDAAPEAEPNAELRRLDTFGLTDVDFLKIDCEGYELHVLQGAEDMLRRCRPVVIVEQKPGMAQRYGLPETGAVAFLESLGAVQRREMIGDYILSWPEAA